MVLAVVFLMANDIVLGSLLGTSAVRRRSARKGPEHDERQLTACPRPLASCGDSKGLISLCALDKGALLRQSREAGLRRQGD
jgi:hypothetical protein